MSAYKYYIIGRGVIILANFFNWLGASVEVRNAVIVAYLNIMATFVGDYIIWPLGMIAYIYDTLSSINVSLPDWVTWVYDFVHDKIAPKWSWVINNVHNLINAMNNIADTVSNLVLSYVNNLTSIWSNAWSFAKYLYTNFAELLKNFLKDPGAFIAAVFNTLLSGSLSWLGLLRSAWTNVIKPFLSTLTSFLPNPVDFIISAVRSLAPALFTMYDDIVGFIKWWRQKGSSYLVALTNDPVGFIFSLIRDNFLQWLAELIAREL